jgi:hypothetical protein
VLIQPVDRKTFEERTFPHAYDAVVYREDGHYYAKDRRGNLICVDSETACLQEAVDAVNNKKLGWIDNEGVGIIEVLTDIAISSQVVITPLNRLWIRFHGNVWIGWINPPSSNPYGAIMIGDGSQATWVDRPIIIEGGVFASDPNKPNLYAFQINRIHGVVIRDVNVTDGNLADVVGEATKTLIDHCQIANPAGMAIQFRAGPYSFGPGGSHVNRVLIQSGSSINPNSGGIAIYDNTIWVSETWIETVPNAIVVNPPQGSDYPQLILQNSVISTSQNSLINNLITINSGNKHYPHIIKNNFFSILNPTTYAIYINASGIDPIIEGNTARLYDGAGFINATVNNDNYTISRNNVRIFSPQKSHIFNITGKLSNLIIDGNNFYNYYYNRLEANGGVYYGPGSTTIYIPHGLGVTPSRYIIIPVNTPEPSSVAVDDTKITLSYPQIE